MKYEEHIAVSLPVSLLATMFYSLFQMSAHIRIRPLITKKYFSPARALDDANLHFQKIGPMFFLILAPSLIFQEICAQFLLLLLLPSITFPEISQNLYFLKSFFSFVLPYYILMSYIALSASFAYLCHGYITTLIF